MFTVKSPIPPRFILKLLSVAVFKVKSPDKVAIVPFKNLISPIVKEVSFANVAKGVDKFIILKSPVPNKSTETSPVP